MIRIEDYDFIDFGASKGTSIKTAIKLFNAPKGGVGIDIDPKKIQVLKEFGLPCALGDVTKVQFPKSCVRFVTAFHAMELLPDLEVVEKALSTAMFYARDFIYIQGPCFDYDDFLAKHGLKFFWSDWTGHPCHLTVGQCFNILESLGCSERARFFVRGPIERSEHQAIHPLASPTDQFEWDYKIHPPKASVNFDPPIWAEFSCMVQLNNNADFGRKLKDIIRFSKEVIPVQTGKNPSIKLYPSN